MLSVVAAHDLALSSSQCRKSLCVVPVWVGARVKCDVDGLKARKMSASTVLSIGRDYLVVKIPDHYLGSKPFNTSSYSLMKH